MDNSVQLTVGEVGARLGISKWRVYRRILSGDIPATRVRSGNVRYMVDQVDLDTYIAAGGAKVLTPPPIEDDDMLSVVDVAMMTGYRAETIRKWCADGVIEAVRGNGKRGHYRIPKVEATKIGSSRAS